MAESREDLEALRSSREDLFDLALKLGAAGMPASPAQLLESHDLLMGLRLAGALPKERLEWAGYLAPIFCRSAAEQEAFQRIFSEWVETQPKIAPDPAPEPTKAPEKDIGTRNWRGALAAILFGLLLGGYLWMGYLRYLEPLFPERGTVVKSDDERKGDVNPLPKPKEPAPDAPNSLPSRPPEQNIPPALPLGPYDFTSAQLAELAAALSGVPFLLWLLWSYIDRRIVLTKKSGEAPEDPHTYWVRGAVGGLFHPADFSFSGARFREPVSRPTRRLHLRKTVAATVREAGLFTPVLRRRRRHPEHLVLIDRASLPSPAANPAAPPASRDHLAAFGETLIDQFRAEQVIGHVYHFDRDPRRCRSAELGGGVLDLAALEARHGECRLIVLSDAAGLFEPLSGRPASWLDEFERWPLRVLLTPRPVEEWGYPEGTLALAGFAVAPLHPRSLALLADVWLPLALREDASEESLRRVRLLAPAESRVAPLPELIRRYGDRWLDPVRPESAPLSALIAELRAYLGEDGLTLLQALAVYPELSWPLTLYVDWKLSSRYAEWQGVAKGKGEARRSLRLLSLARLPWLRHGRMPDYLRLALVRGLSRQRHGEVVEIYRDLLKAVDGQGPHAIALHIGPPATGGFLTRLRNWAFKAGGQFGDRIFARVLLGGTPGWLEVELPELLARLLPGTGWEQAAARVLSVGAGAVLVAGGVFASLSHYRTGVDQWLKEQEQVRHAAVQVKIVKASPADWQAAPLESALKRAGFTIAVEEPSATGGEAAPMQQSGPPAARLQVNVLRVGREAAAAGRWVARRLRHVSYGAEVRVIPETDAKESTPASAKEIVVQLADIPQVFQDSLAGSPPPFIEPEMMEIPAGQFLMGSPALEAGRSLDESPQHKVKIGRFALGVKEVTFDEYDAFARATGRELPADAGWGRGQRPVINVSWEDAQVYAAWLSEKTGKAYRLPTEAEWEYAARAGTVTSRYWGDDPGQGCTYANVADQTARREVPGWYAKFRIHDCADGYVRTAPVGSFKANAFGLHDMLGNVWEWVADCYHDSYWGAPEDGRGWEDKKSCDSGVRVLRGGSWDTEASYVRSAYRFRYLPGERYVLYLGFRLARTL